MRQAKNWFRLHRQLDQAWLVAMAYATIPYCFTRDKTDYSALADLTWMVTMGGEMR